MSLEDLEFLVVSAVLSTDTVGADGVWGMDDVDTSTFATDKLSNDSISVKSPVIVSTFLLPA